MNSYIEPITFKEGANPNKWEAKTDFGTYLIERNPNPEFYEALFSYDESDTA